MSAIRGRALHYVFKIPERKRTGVFFRDILGMKVLRHEEFSDGCEAACNGPYANRWSKTMVGYGPEDTHFVIELTYNYTVKSYEQGNDFVGITIRDNEILKRAKQLDWKIGEDNSLLAPGGYRFFIEDLPPPKGDPVVKVALASSNLDTSLKFWNGLLGLKVYDKGAKKVLLGFADDQAKLELVDIGSPVELAAAYGRIAFSCPHDQQPQIDEAVKKANQKILTPLISLDTPGKATVRVIILADPDGHEICFVDDEAFRQLSAFDPDGDKEFNKFSKKDAD